MNDSGTIWIRPGVKKKSPGQLTGALFVYFLGRLLLSLDIHVIANHSSENAPSGGSDDGALDLVPAGRGSDNRPCGSPDSCIALCILYDNLGSRRRRWCRVGA